MMMIIIIMIHHDLARWNLQPSTATAEIRRIEPCRGSSKDLLQLGPLKVFTTLSLPSHGARCRQFAMELGSSQQLGDQTEELMELANQWLSVANKRPMYKLCCGKCYLNVNKPSWVTKLMVTEHHMFSVYICLFNSSSDSFTHPVRNVEIGGIWWSRWPVQPSKHHWYGLRGV